MSVNSIVGEGDHDIHDKSNAREGTPKKKREESATRRNTFNINEERQTSIKVDKDDT